MTSLLYRPGWEEARKRLTVWWNGGDIGRPAMQITCPRSEPFEEIPAMPEPEGWISHYSTQSLPYRVNLALRACLYTDYLAEAVPAVTPGDLAPNCLALYLGCHGVEMPETTWCEPCIENAESARFAYDPENFYWRFSIEAYSEVAMLTDGKVLQQFPDLIEGLDTLAAMRGNHELLEDLLDRPEWVAASLRQITDRYFHHYDILYNLIRDEVGGSVFWAWSPGRMAKFQCDFSAMISPAMFSDFMVPVLTEMSERIAHSMYHWDGPGALCHQDALLSIPRLDMIQWTPGAGSEPAWHNRWWPYYHKTLDAGKKLYIWAENKDQLLALKAEFGEQIKGMLIAIGASDQRQAEDYIRAVEF
ncbi:MAG: hypothetical protein IT210_17525 [Armatimonadetes bacterium]|nr:hypothetical protein [Armatimonadota bacterium]